MIFVWEHAGVREVHAQDFGGLSTYLRIIRNGTSFTGYYGVTADTPLRLWEYQTGMTNFRMGLAAWGGSAAAIPADFDTLLREPLGRRGHCCESGTLSGSTSSNCVYAKDDQRRASIPGERDAAAQAASSRLLRSPHRRTT